MPTVHGRPELIPWQAHPGVAELMRRLDDPECDRPKLLDDLKRMERDVPAVQGYVATPDGLVRWDVAPSTLSSSLGEARGVAPVVGPQFGPAAAAVRGRIVAPPDERRKRTEAERLDALTRRVTAQFALTGSVPESIVTEVQAEGWKQGKPLTVEDARLIAAHYLRKAAARKAAADARHTTRDPARVG